MSPDGMQRHQSANNFSRRTLLRATGAAGSLAAMGLLAGCGGDSASAATSGSSPKATAHPSYYPGDYDKIVAAAKKEGGKLTIYSNMDVVNWKPIIDGFKKLYPFVSDVSTNNLDSSEVFSRYYSESAAGKSPASLMVSGDPSSWLRFAQDGHGMDYKSPEASHLPSFGNPKPGLYTFSADPILMAWNKTLLTGDKVPTGLGSLAKLVHSDPGTFKDKITTYDIGATSFGFAIDWNYVKQVGTAWQVLQKLLPSTRPESSSGPMVEKLQSGEYVAGYFLSSTVVLPAVEKNDTLLGWSYIDDGTPIFLRGMAIPKTAPQTATAKLMLDYILSQPGQVQICNGGFTPYRNGMGTSVPRSYEQITKKVGKKNIVMIGYDEVPKATEKAFIKRWEGYLGH